MLGKNRALITNIDDAAYRKRLQVLYARKSTLDILIETLEQYDRFQAKGERGKLRTA